MESPCCHQAYQFQGYIDRPEFLFFSSLFIIGIVLKCNDYVSDIIKLVD